MMDYLISFLTFLEVSSALLIVVVILMQRSRSGGGLGAMAGGATEEVFGSSAGNVLTKATIILSVVFFINTLSLAVLQGNVLRDRNVSIVEKAAQTDSALPKVDDQPDGKDSTSDTKLTGTNEVTPQSPPKGTKKSSEKK